MTEDTLPTRRQLFEMIGKAGGAIVMHIEANDGVQVMDGVTMGQPIPPEVVQSQPGIRGVHYTHTGPLSELRFTETWRNLKLAHGNVVVFRSMLGISWMWFLGAIFLIAMPQLIALGKDALPPAIHDGQHDDDADGGAKHPTPKRPNGG